MIALWFIIGAIGLLAIDGVRYLQAQREVQAFAQSAARTGAQEINTQAFAYCRIGIDDCAWYIGFSARATTQAIAPRQPVRLEVAAAIAGDRSTTSAVPGR